MLKSIRRNSKQFFEPRRKSIVSLITTPEVAHAAKDEPSPTKQRPLTFFDLPAEIRNEIYELIANETRIFVPAPAFKKSSKALPSAPPSLLLVSGQTRREFLPLLLEIAPIRCVIKDLDFSNLTRIISSLYSTELRALRHNPAFTILLQIEKCNRDTIASLRRWLVNRGEGLDRIAFQYGIVYTRHTQIIPTSSQVHRINVYIQRRALLSTHLEAMAQLFSNVGETERFELEPIMKIFEEEFGSVSSADPNRMTMYGLSSRRF